MTDQVLLIKTCDLRLSSGIMLHNVSVSSSRALILITVSSNLATNWLSVLYNRETLFFLACLFVAWFCSKLIFGIRGTELEKSSDIIGWIGELWSAASSEAKLKQLKWSDWLNWWTVLSSSQSEKPISSSSDLIGWICELCWNAASHYQRHQIQMIN